MGREPVKYFGVRVASSSTIEIDFNYAGQRCRERIKQEPTPANLKKMSQFRGSIIQAIESGEFDYGVTFPNSKNAAKFAPMPKAVGLTVATYLDTWLDEKKRKVKASTWDDYRKIVNSPLVPSLGGKMLVDLKRVDVKDMVKGMACSNKRIANILSVLRTALDDAVQDDLLDKNPIHDWSYVNSEAVKKESDVDPFTAEEQTLILSGCDGQYRNLIAFAFWTGLRTSEFVALGWDDIDWQRGVICVTKALTAVSDEFEDTKTRAGRREVKILTPTMQALVSQKAHTFLKGGEVFQNPRTGERWSGDQAIRKVWASILRKVKVRYRRPYQTRHTYASMMLSAGEHPMWVAQQLGHSDWGMIRRIYGRYMQESAPDAGGKAVGMFGNVDKNVDKTTPINPKLASTSK